MTGLRDPIRRFVLSKSPDTFDAVVDAAVHEERNELMVASDEKVRVMAISKDTEHDELAQLTKRLERLERLLSDRMESN